MQNQEEFVPTYLYLKQHNKTNLLYFGKTTKDPLIYKGSGKYWLRHLKIHGNDISTIWYKLFYNKTKLTEFATYFSKFYNIDKSEKFANFILENGLDGKPKGSNGHKFTNEEIEKISKSSKNNWNNPEIRNKIIESQKNSFTEERKNNHKEYMKNTFWTEQRKKQHSEKLKGRTGHKKCKGISKHPKFGSKISKALKNKSKTEEHRLNLSKSKCDCPIIDHLGNIFINPKQFGLYYDISGKNFFDSLDKPITRQPTFDRLGIEPTLENRLKTKKELGFNLLQKEDIDLKLL
jgi:hypothetical protein